MGVTRRVSGDSILVLLGDVPVVVIILPLLVFSPSTAPSPLPNIVIRLKRIQFLGELDTTAPSTRINLLSCFCVCVHPNIHYSAHVVVMFNVLVCNVWEVEDGCDFAEIVLVRAARERNYVWGC